MIRLESIEVVPLDLVSSRQGLLIGEPMNGEERQGLSWWSVVVMYREWLSQLWACM